VEWILAIELQAAGRVLTILPILIGKTRDAVADIDMQRLPTIVPMREVEVVQKFLQDNSVQPTSELSTRTVRQTVEMLTQQFLAVQTWALCGKGKPDSHGVEMAVASGSLPAVHQAEMFEACTVKAAKAVQETLKLREEEAVRAPELHPVVPMEAAPPEGVPPTSRSDVQCWDQEQLAEWLRDVMKLEDIAKAATEEEVDGATALEMLRDDWMELGAPGLKAAKVVAQLKKLALVQGTSA
jgi:hypothetical protein